MAEIESITAFTQLALAPPILAAVQAIGYEAPSPIQAKSIPHLLAGRDLLGLAQTGTGKTAAFALPLLSRLHLDQHCPQVLVLTPTRELAIQVAEAFQCYARHLPDFQVLPVYGGQDMRGQLRGLKRGAHVVVGTPGRIMDHIRRGSLQLDHIGAVVLDEADEMLRMGFVDDIDWIMARTPADRQVALFSATMPRVIRKIAGQHLKQPVFVEIQAQTATVDTITQKVWMVSGLHKLDALTRILEVEPFDAMIVFVRTKSATVELAEKLAARGFAAAALNGDMSQSLREQVVTRLKREALDILVATDVAARGLDVERISHVVNYDIPHDTEAYVHRIGRTGRAGRQGIAILFAAHRERRMLRAIEQATRQRIDSMTLPSMRAVRDQRIKQFKETVVQVLENTEQLAPFQAVVTELLQEQQLAPEAMAAALCYLAQKDRPFPDGKEPERPRDNWQDKPRRDQARQNRRYTRERATDGSVRYRLNLGREQGIMPRDVVGALANEGGIQGSDIGPIRLFARCTSVYLPAGLSRDALNRLNTIKIRNQPLMLRLWQDGNDQPSNRKYHGYDASERRY